MRGFPVGKKTKNNEFKKQREASKIKYVQRVWYLSGKSKKKQQLSSRIRSISMIEKCLLIDYVFFSSVNIFHHKDEYHNYMIKLYPYPSPDTEIKCFPSAVNFKPVAISKKEYHCIFGLSFC